MALQPSHAADQRVGRVIPGRLSGPKPRERRKCIGARNRQGMVARMTTNAQWIKVDPARVVHTLQRDAVEKVNAGEGEVLLDFAGIPRIHSSVVKALEELARLASDRSV